MEADFLGHIKWLSNALKSVDRQRIWGCIRGLCCLLINWCIFLWQAIFKEDHCFDLLGVILYEWVEILITYLLTYWLSLSLYLPLSLYLLLPHAFSTLLPFAIQSLCMWSLHTTLSPFLSLFLYFFSTKFPLPFLHPPSLSVPLFRSLPFWMSQWINWAGL